MIFVQVLQEFGNGCLVLYLYNLNYHHCCQKEFIQNIFVQIHYDECGRGRIHRSTYTAVLHTMYKLMAILTSSGEYFLGKLVTFENGSCFTEEFQDF